MMLRKTLISTTSMLLALAVTQPVRAAHYFRQPLAGITTTSGPATDAPTSGGNRPPVFGSVSWPTAGTIGIPLSWSRPDMATDPEGNAVSYRFTGLPAGLVGTASGAISGTPQTQGSYTVAVEASDPSGASAATSFAMTIAPANRAPVWNLAQWGIGLTEGNVDQYYWWGYSNAAIDPDGDAITYSATGLPCCLMMASSSGAIYGYPMNAGSYPVTLVATDSKGAAASQPGTLIVNPETGTAPYFVWTDWPTSATVGTAIDITPANPAQDDDGDPITYYATSLPPGLSIDPGTGVLSGTPTSEGYYSVTIIASDPSTKYGTSYVDIYVSTPPNRAPEFQSVAWPTNATVYQNLAATPEQPAIDPDGDPLHYAANNLPSGVDIDPDTGVISGAPYDTGTFDVQVMAWDDYGHWIDTTFTLQVDPEPPPVNHPPVFRDIAWPTEVDTSHQVTSEANPAVDPDNDSLRYTAIGLPAGLSIHPSTGEIRGVPWTTGFYHVTIMADDIFYDHVAETSFDMVVTNGPNHPPEWTDPPGSSERVYTVEVPFEWWSGPTQDPDGDATTVTLAGTLPDGLTFDGQSIVGTSSATGRYDITFTLTDARGATASRSYVLRSNQPPLIKTPLPSQIDTIARINDPLIFPTNLGAYMSDPDGDALSYTPSSGFGGATISADGATYNPNVKINYNYSNGYMDITNGTILVSDPFGASTEVELPTLRAWIAFGTSPYSTSASCAGATSTQMISVVDAFAGAPTDIKVQLPATFGATGKNTILGYTVEKEDATYEWNRYRYLVKITYRATESGTIPATVTGSRGDQEAVPISFSCPN